MNKVVDDEQLSVGDLWWHHGCMHPENY